ncbi:MAG: nucleotidyltransferase [Bacteroidales bacterium]|nr:nucleotidyltransferase [Bacteroidales bacterium]
MKPTLFIMAAGIGSRYGGLKQLDKIGPSGETIMDYSVFDAMRAGFGKVVFVIRKNIENEFKSFLQNRYADKIKVEYVFQELDKIPVGFKVPEQREKPWGTAHAVMMGAELINEPFAVINADDFYGADAFKIMARFLSENKNDHDYCMVGYELKKTLSEHGHVARGVCEVSEEGNLIGIVERLKIGYDNSRIVFETDANKKVQLTGKEIVSMNIWGFKPSFYKYAEKEFISFLSENITTPKSEFLIPTVINKLVKQKKINLNVLRTSSTWFGVTYKEDRPVVVQKLQDLVDNGEYPLSLWNE